MPHRYRKFCILLFAFFIISCGAPAIDVPLPLAMQQPSVIGTSPAKTSRGHPHDPIIVHFSQPVDPKSLIDTNAVIVTQTEVDTSATEILAQATLPEQQVPMNPALDAAGTTITLTPQTELPVGPIALVVTNAVHSTNGIPFSQQPGIGNQAFVATYAVVDTADVSTTSGSVGGSPETGAASPTTPLASTDVITATTATAVAAIAVGTPIPPLLPAELMINEMLYDVPGVDTNGQVFIELRGTPGASLAQYMIRFVNGDDGKLTDTLVLPTGALIRDTGFFVIADAMTNAAQVTTVANADLIDNFDPQNGPDTVQLLGPDGTLVDVLGYGTPLPALDATNLVMYDGAPAVKVSAGRSLSRLPGAAHTHNNATDFVANTAPSPGTAEVTPMVGK